MGLFSRRRPPVTTALDVRAEQRLLTEAVLRSAASLIASEDDAHTTITRHCETLTVLAPHIVLAWTWFGPSATARIEPQVVAGRASAYGRTLSIERSLLTEIGPAFRTLAGKQLEPFRVSTMSLFRPWRQAAAEHGVCSVLALPLQSTVESQSGLFVLYADVEDYFDHVGVGVFDALGHLIGAVLSRAGRNAELARAANCDALTGLSNRHAVALLDPELRRITAHDQPVSVVMLDLDHFKTVNDTYGHHAGDLVLTHFAHLVASTLRREDGFGRLGGEEFMLLFPNIEPAGLTHIVNRVLEMVRAGRPLPNVPEFGYTCSAGVAMMEPGLDATENINKADRAVYAAKAQGRNRLEWAT